MGISSVLNNKEKIIERIIEETGISRDKLDEMIKKKIEEYGGLLTEAGAAFSIARELGVKIEIKQEKEEWTDISKVNEDLGFVNIAGIVKAVTLVKEFDRDGGKGKVVRILVADSSGEIWVVLWNQDAELVEAGKIGPGTIIGVKNGTIRKNLAGELEINVGMRGRVIINPNIDKELPEIEKPKRISELREGMENISIYGKVLAIFPKREFSSGDRTGKVASIIVSDGTEARVVLWGDLADMADKLSIGDIVKIENAYTKENNGKLEIHLNWKSRLVLNPQDAPDLDNISVRKIIRKKISELKPSEFVEVRGVVVHIYPPNIINICPVCGEIVEDICPEHGTSKKTIILNMEIDDGTDVIRGVMFRELAERFLGIKEVTDEEIREGMDRRLGDELVFEGNVKENKLFDRNELHVKSFSQVDLNQEIEMLRGD